jgi:hypothetical protein
MMSSAIRSMLAAAAALLVCSATAVPMNSVTIDFDDQPGGLPAVPTDGLFNPHASFSTTAGATLLIFDGAAVFGGSAPNSMSAAVDTNAGPFNSDIYVDFTVPVQGLSFKVLADNEADPIAKLRFFHGGALSDTLDVIGNADIANPIPIDLSAYAGVTRVELYEINDAFGLAVDDFAFSVPVPEMPTPLLLGGGLLALAAWRRRFNWA